MKTARIIAAALAALALAACQSAPNNPVLSIEGGQIQGVVLEDVPGVYVYRGIPYAAPPRKVICLTDL